MEKKQVRKKVNVEILRIANEEVSLRATKFANTMLASNFRSIFRIHQSSEFSEPEVYQLGDDPHRILWSRLSTYHARNFATSMANEDILAKRYQLISEYEFVALVDVSRSMMVKWWSIYGSKLAENEKPRQVEDLCSSKVFLLKYILVSFLVAARTNGFISRVILFGGGKSPTTLSSREEPELEKTVLTYIDDHFDELASPPNKPEDVSLPAVLKEQIEYQRRRIILCLSDFTDGIIHCREKKKEPRLKLRDIAPYFTELAYKYRLLVVRINDQREVKLLSGLPGERIADTPYVDVEKNPKRGKEITIYEKDRRYFIGQAKSWYRDLDNALKRYGAILGIAVGGQEIDRMLYRVSAIQERI